MLKKVILIFLVILCQTSYSQKILGVDFKNKWDEAKLYYTLDLDKSIKNVLLTSEKSKDKVYSYEFMIHNFYNIQRLLNTYKSIYDSLSFYHGIPQLDIQKNNFQNITLNSFLQKIYNKEIVYNSKWNKSDNWNYIIETKIKSDGNIYVKITDSSKYISESDLIDIYNKENEIKLKNEIEYFKNIELKGKDLIKKYSNYGLAIFDYEAFDNSEFTEGTGFRVNVFNPTKKTIKYININFIGINPVNDKVINKYKNSYTNNVRAVGPLKSMESGYYEWDYVWFTDIVETIKITSINVQFMDGTIKSITDINKIVIKDEDKEAILYLSKEY